MAEPIDGVAHSEFCHHIILIPLIVPQTLNDPQPKVFVAYLQRSGYLDMISRLAILGLLLSTGLSLAACDNKGPAEKAGEKIDKAGQKIGDAVDPPGPVEKAGRAVDNAVNSATNSN